MSKKNEKSFVPKLRFPEFRDAGAWETRELGEFITERNQFPTGSVSLFSLTIEDGITPKTERYERSFLVNDKVGAYKLVLPDDFAYNPMNLRFGAIGRHSGIENVAVSKYYNIFFCDKTVDSKFCEIYFKSDQMIAFYDNMAIGSLIEKRRVHFSDFLKFNIRFPLLLEQQKIADCLSSLDELITVETQKLEAYKDHKKGLMQKLFPAEGKTVPGLRFPEFRNAGEWEEKEIGKILNIGNGRDHKHLPDGDIPVYGSGGYMRSVNDYLYDGESVCIGRKGTIDNPVLLSGKFWTVDTLFYTHSFMDCLPRFVFALFLRIDWLKHNEAGGIPSLSKTNIAKIKVPIPRISEQQKIADCLFSLDELITAQAQKVETLKAHKKGLMQGLFPSADEVAV